MLYNKRRKTERSVRFPLKSENQSETSRLYNCQSLVSVRTSLLKKNKSNDDFNKATGLKLNGREQVFCFSETKSIGKISVKPLCFRPISKDFQLYIKEISLVVLS